LVLEASPSTGYGWSLSAGATGAIETVGAPVYESASKEPRPGAPGRESWRFRAVRPGKETIRLDYRRPWDKAAPPARTVTVTADVR
jgi:predicted secreted protein